MKAPLSWLKEYTDINKSPDEIADMLTHLGLEVEEVTGSYVFREGIVVGKVIENGRHPNADRLSVNKVDVGTEILDVVCGAPNCRLGLTVALIKSGFKLPDGMEIKKSKIRGEISNGMLCSMRELGISEEADGIIELSETLKPGTPITAELLAADPVFTVAILPNRPDGLSVTGLAREIAAKSGSKFTMPAIKIQESGVDVKSKVKVTIKNPEGCPRYTARLISGVKLAPSPEWMVNRLKACGVRPINNVVDITNYVMLELGQPLHAFDYSKIAGSEIIVRRAVKGEKMFTLDNAERELLESDLLICDKDKPVALAGVMGGASSEVSDTTVDILLESAYFEPVSIRKTSRRLGLISESSYRFERGVDPTGVVIALNRAASLMAELAGGTVAVGLIDENPGNIQEKKLTVRIDKICKILGVDISEKEIKGSLESIGIRCDAGSVFEAVIPARRPDITIEEDIIEEVARLIGYDRVPVNAKATVSLALAPNLREQFRENARDILSGIGLTEIVTNSLVHIDQLTVLGMKESAPVLINALSPDMSVLRTSMIPSILNVIQWNKSRKNDNIAVFEIGKVFDSKGANVQPDEKEVIAAAFSGLSSPKRWDGKDEYWNFATVSGLVETVVDRMAKQKVKFSAEKWGVLDSVNVLVGKSVVGRVASISNSLLKKFDIKDSVIYFELYAEVLRKLKPAVVKYTPVSKFPSSDRDLALVTDSAVSAVDMADAIKQESPLVEEVTLFDVYEGDKLGAGKKSTAFSIRLRKADATLTESEVEAVVSKVLDRLKKKFGAEIR
ncbi:MAG: phenylalanine--tRNA ligase subunit beta [Fibrobacteres bacterium]|nr:phenylalanine--tRNA ligase subunit beta [Fibrobacterota bacterium]